MHKHYKVSRTLDTHTVRATCAEVECDNYRYGWTTPVDESTELGRRQATLIRANRRGQFVESRSPEGFTMFHFKPGCQCFEQHYRALEREPFYVVEYGHHRRVHDNAVNWVEDFAKHQDNLAKAAR